MTERTHQEMEAKETIKAPATEASMPDLPAEEPQAELAETPVTDDMVSEILVDAAQEGQAAPVQPDAAAPDLETPLILAVQHILSLSGLAFSPGAVRDLPELTRKAFDPQSAVSALRHVGFEASYGDLSPAELTAGHCPAIGFLNDGRAVVAHAVDDTGRVTLRLFDEDGVVEEIVPKDQLAAFLVPYFVLARKVHAAAKARGKNDWFWGSLLQGKWLYVQVLVAAAITNFLGLSTSLFIMVVYDRVVPNESGLNKSQDTDFVL